MDIAITGMGVVSPMGNNIHDYFKGLRDGVSPTRAVALPNDPEGRSIWCATVDQVDLPAWFDDKLREGTDVVSQWAVTAAEQAIAQARLVLDPLRTAVVHGTSLCGVQSVMRAQYEVDQRGPGGFPPKTMMKALTNMAAAQICMRHRLHGPSLTVTTACASTLDALGTAARLISSGLCDAAIVGGTEAGENLGSGGAEEGFVPAMVYAPAAFGMQSPATAPELASVPFDVKRSGVAGSEGSTFFVLERGDRARAGTRAGTRTGAKSGARESRVLGYLRGYASLADGFHPSAPDPSGQWEAKAMEMALDDADISTNLVDGLIAHGTATPIGDTAEIRAINQTYRGRASPLPVSSTKGHFGHAAAASGGMSLIAALVGMSESIFVHTAHTDDPDPEADFDLVMQTPREMEMNVLQINAFGFGGQNASIVVSKT